MLGKSVLTARRFVEVGFAPSAGGSETATTSPQQRPRPPLACVRIPIAEVPFPAHRTGPAPEDLPERDASAPDLARRRSDPRGRLGADGPNALRARQTPRRSL